MACGADGRSRTAGGRASCLAARGGAERACWKVGPRLAGAWWAAGLIDQVAAFVCPGMVAGHRASRRLCRRRGPAAMDEALALREVEVRADAATTC